MKNRSKGFLYGGCVGGISGLLVIIAGVYLFINAPPIGQILPQNSTPILITFNTPENNTKWPSNAFIPVFATAISQKPIASLELLADGSSFQTFNPENGTNPTQYYLQTSWSPIVEGFHSLVVRATDVDGRVTTSNVITIEATEPVGFNVLYTTQKGDTLKSLGTKFNVTEEEIVLRNPQLNTTGSIPANQSVVIPQPAVTVPPPQLPSEAAQSTQPVGPVSTNPPSDFLFWLKRYTSPATSAPTAPQLSYSVENGQLYLQFNDLSNNEDGFFVYQANPDSGVNERIAALEPNTPTYPMKLSSGGSGRENYFVSAFNIAGESPSNPISLDPNDPSLSTSQSNLKFEDGNLILPLPVEKAYFYTSLDKNPYQRFPPDITAFIIPTNHTIPFALLNPSQDAQPLVRAVDLEGWGWFGSSLVELGDFHAVFGNTNLSMCYAGISCTTREQYANRGTHGIVWSDSAEEVEFYWDTPAPGVTSALWQIALSPFPQGFQPDPPDLIAGGCVAGDHPGSFRIVFSEGLNQYSSAPTNCAGLAPLIERPTISGLVPPATLYLRLIPMAGNQPAAKPSNTVEIEYKSHEGIPPTVAANHLPAIYKIEIVEYKPARYAQKEYWGCVYIKNLDINMIKASIKSQLDSKHFPMSEDLSIQIANSLYSFLYPFMVNQWPICPKDVEESSQIMELLSFAWEGLKSFWDTVVAIFDTVKGGIVDGVASLVNCQGECKTWLRRGLEAGFTAMTGIPPNIPKFDEMTEMGINYAIELAVSQAGISTSCGEDCRQLIHDGLKGAIDKVKQESSQPGCVSESQAEGHGKMPLCFPAGVFTEAVAEGVNSPAIVKLKVTNVSTQTTQGFYVDQPTYTVNVRVTSRNNNLNGKTLYYSYPTHKYPNTWGQPPNEPILLFVPINRELYSMVFREKQLTIPALQPGDSMEIPLVLEAAVGIEYMIAEHIIALSEALQQRGLNLDDVGGYNGDSGYEWYDWKCLYQSGRIKIEANLMCLSTSSGQIIPNPNSTLVSCDAQAVPWEEQEPSASCVP
jgi:LysM repeat protein